MKEKVLATTMAALMTVPLTVRGGGTKETTAAITTAEEKVEDITVAESKNETSAEAAKTETAEEAAGGKLAIVVDAEFPSYECHDGDAIAGIDVEIAKVITDESGMGLEIEDIAFNFIIPEIVPSKANTGLAGMTIMEDRTQSIDFPDTYVKASQKIIVTENSEIASPSGLKGVIVDVQLGTTGDIYVLDLGTNGTTVERYNRGFEAAQALSQGKIDAVVIDGEPTKTFVAETEGLKILDRSFTDEKYAIVVKKGNTELLEKINGALKTLKDNGTLDEVVAEHIKAEQSYRVWNRPLKTDTTVPAYAERRSI